MCRHVTLFQSTKFMHIRILPVLYRYPYSRGIPAQPAAQVVCQDFMSIRTHHTQAHTHTVTFSGPLLLVDFINTHAHERSLREVN